MIKLNIYDDKDTMGTAAAREISLILNHTIKESGEASMILATGASQFEMLEHLVQENVDWTKVTAFHLDEYINLSDSHPASFRKYLKERFVDRISGLKAFYYINGENSPERECDRLGQVISQYSISVACIGIGENGHLAFNDPPADFDTEAPYIVVNLDAACRQQQLGEGWFPTFDAVPKKAISMSIKSIMKSKAIVCTVPDARKANAVKAGVEGEVTNMVPASILQLHSNCSMYLDTQSAYLLKNL